MTLEFGVGRDQPPVHPDQGAADRGHPRHQFGDLGAGHLAGVGLCGEDIGEVGHQARVAVGCEVIGVEIELPGQGEQDRDGDGRWSFSSWLT